MYLREIHKAERDQQLDIIRMDGLGHIIGVEDGMPYVSHHPFIVHGNQGEEKLEWHVPKVNPHLQSMNDGEMKMVVFEGPKHYMSPRWCQGNRALPTWAFVAVHVYGRPQLIEDPVAIRAGLGRLVDFNEGRLGDPWSLDSVDDEHVSRTMTRIVGFEMRIERMEGNFRLIQERPAVDRRNVAEALSKLPDTRAQGVAELIRKYSPDGED